MNEGLKTSQAGLDLITKWEGLKLQTYICPAGKPTIGVGHVVLSGENFAGGITREKALEILASDVEKFERGIQRNISVPLSQNQFDALVSWTYNVGPAAMAKSTLMSHHNAGRVTDAANEFARWNRAGGKPMAGLTRRRKAEADLYRSLT